MVVQKCGQECQSQYCHQLLMIGKLFIEELKMLFCSTCFDMADMLIMSYPESELKTYSNLTAFLLFEVTLANLMFALASIVPFKKLVPIQQGTHVINGVSFLRYENETKAKQRLTSLFG
jgi:hypothetical protein